VSCNKLKQSVLHAVGDTTDSDTPAGAERFPQLRPACAEPTPGKRSGRREKAARTALARNKI
jgi:hypothetical protein